MLIGIRDKCIKSGTLEERMTALKDLGCDFTELVVDPAMLDELIGDPNPGPYAPKPALRALNRTVSKTGLPILSVSFGDMYMYSTKDDAGREATRRGLRKSVDLANRMGAGTVLAAVCEKNADFREMALMYRAELREILDFALSRNVRVCFEPVAGFNTESTALLVRCIHHPAAFLYFDMGNCLHFGENLITRLNECADITGALHIKPGPGMDLDEMPLCGILNLLYCHGFGGIGVIEMEAGEGNKTLTHVLDLLDRLGYRS